MSTLFQAVISQSVAGQMLTAREVSRFSAAEIRLTIAELVGADRLDLADALSAAGLSLYPESEDILSISALLSEIKKDWTTAEQLLTQLLSVQGNQATSFTWRHLIRVLRCQLEPGKAFSVAKEAIASFPNDVTLNEEFLALQEMVSKQSPVEASSDLH